MWIKGQTLWPLFDLARWDEILQIADELISWERVHGRSYFGAMALSSKAQVLVRRGAVDEAAPLAEEFLPRAREIGDPQVLSPALVVAALTEQARGKFAAALTMVEELAETTRDPFRANQVTDAVRICSAAGQLPLARKMLDAVPVAMARHRHALLTGQAVVSEAEGNFDQASERYAEAAEGWKDYGHVPEQALALLGHGRCLVTLGQPGADQPLRDARNLFAGMDYEPALAETEALLEQTAATPTS
jgi:tetratricopeptide (TPR) repeat protein